MQVTELARRAGVSPRSVRHYDRAGLLDSGRRSNGYRDFGYRAVDQVREIKKLLESGLTVAEIVALQPCLTAEGEFDGCAESREILDAHVARLTASIDRDRDTLTRLRDRQRQMTPRL